LSLTDYNQDSRDNSNADPSYGDANAVATIARASGSDFSSDYTKEVDQLLAGVFRNHPNVTGVTLRWSAERAHTATPDAPFGSPNGAEYARIDAAQARGELTPAQAIAALKKIHRPVGE
jgi:hypothetical protein